MSWEKCQKCISVPRPSHCSDLLKVLLALHNLHGSRTGAKGATFEDIAMHMIKHFSLDGDIKSQVLASLKYGVKMNYIAKRKDKFSLIAPASSIHLAPCKYKKEEIERIQCIFPPSWYSNVCNNICAVGPDDTCCGKAKRSLPNLCCDQDANEDAPENPCALCKKKKKPESNNSCHVCAQNKAPKPCPPPCPPPPCESSSSDEGSPCPKKSNPCPPPCPESSSSSDECLPCPRRKKSKTCSPESSSSEECNTCPKPQRKPKCCPPPIRKSVCARRGTCGRKNKSPWDDYCQFCPEVDDGSDEDDFSMDSCPTSCPESSSSSDECLPSPPRKRSKTCPPESSSSDECNTRPKPQRKPKCCPPAIRKSVCARRGTCGGKSKSLWDDYCQLCPQVDDDENEFPMDAHINCSCCRGKK